MSAKLVTYKESKEARQRATKLIEDVRKNNQIKGSYKFFHRLIGSGKRRCIIKDNNGKYDLDYQIVLTKNCKKSDSDSTELRNRFFQAFRDCSNQNEKIENSTTVITVRVSKSNQDFNYEQEKFSFDFVLISIDELKRNRRNAPNQYTWVELPSKNSYIYNKFNSLTAIKQRYLLEEYVIPKVIFEKNKDEKDRIPSIEIFYQEVNNHVE